MEITQVNLNTTRASTICDFINAVVTVQFEDIHEAPPYLALQNCKPYKLVRLASLSLLQTD